MGEDASQESALVHTMTSVLKGMGLTWEDLDGKKVLDGGASELRLDRAAKIQGSSAQIFSVDFDNWKYWPGLPAESKTRAADAYAEQLPFPDNTFDLIINNAAAIGASILDEARVLKPGGEIRITPIGGQIRDMWDVACYLDECIGLPQEEITKKLQEFEWFIEDHDGWRPNEFAKLEEAAEKTLTKEQKLGVLDKLVTRYSDMTGLPLDYIITNPEASRPDGYIVYTKPLRPRP